MSSGAGKDGAAAMSVRVWIRSGGLRRYMGVPRGSEKEMEKEIESRTFPINRTLRWQQSDAATQRPVDSSKVQNLWNRDQMRPIPSDRT